MGSWPIEFILEAKVRSRQITLEGYLDTWEANDQHANFKAEVVAYSRVDPMITIDRMSRATNISVGALTKYILTKWAASGSEGLLEIGPRVVNQMNNVIEKAETIGDDPTRLSAYYVLRDIISWLNYPLPK
jgi:hypothetical protein